MINKFSQYEIESLDICSDEKGKYAVNINPKTKEAAYINKINKSVIWKLGKCNRLSEKLFDFIDIEITEFDI